MPNSAAVPGRPRSRDAAGLPAVTPDGIVDAALALTARYGLESWTLRQLAGEVQAYPAVVYHHVGDREAVVSAVVDRVIGRFPLPSPELHWQEYFRVQGKDLRTVLREFPGVARRISVYSLNVAAAAPAVDLGVRVLQRAGFGTESAEVYQLLSNMICQLVSVEDELSRHDDVRARSLVTWSEYKDDASRPGLAAMSSYVHGIATDPLRRQSYFADVFDYTLERVLEGLAVRLASIKGT